MRPTLRWSLLAGLALAAGVAGVAWPGAAPRPMAAGKGAALPDRTVVHAFPSRHFDPARLPRPDAPFDPANYPADRIDTAWVVEWELTNPSAAAPPSSVLAIRAAHFMCRDKAGKPRWVTVARALSLGEVFVPYDPGSPRYEDIQDHHFTIQPADPALLGPPCLAAGEILPAADPLQSGRVYKEVHDDGVRWLDDDGQGAADRGRRGEKLNLWANFYAANYRYVIEYGFTDDGVLSCRVGGTARNLKPRQPDGEDSHLHVGCWVFDPDLGDPTDSANGGPTANEVTLVRRVQRTPGTGDGKFRTDVRPFPDRTPGTPAVPGSAAWVPDEFTTLRVESTTRRNGNATPRPLAYDLVTVRTGSSGHFPPPFEYVNRDFWVTAADPSFTQFTKVPEYVSNAPGPLTGKPSRVWHNSPLLHVVRAEDFGPDGLDNGSGQYGVAINAYAGFHLKPRNLFDSTPLFVP